MIHVRQRADRYNEIGSPKSAMSHRPVPMPPLVTNTLKDWKLKCPKGEPGLVFPNGNGNVEFHRNIINRGLIPIQIKAGACAEVQSRDEQGQPLLEADGSLKMIKLAKYPGLHALRHFYASWCINRKVDGGLELPPKIVQAYLGHEDIKLTMDTYGHLFPQTDTSEAFAAAERALLSA
jgi:integrase